MEAYPNIFAILDTQGYEAIALDFLHDSKIPLHQVIKHNSKERKK